MNKVKFAIDSTRSGFSTSETKLLGIDLEKVGCFVYDGNNLELWMDGAAEAICITKSQVSPVAFSQLVDALESEFPEWYGDEFPNGRSDDEVDLPY